MIRLIGVLLALALVLGATTAEAHQRNTSYSSFWIDESGARVVLRAPTRQLTSGGNSPAVELSIHAESLVMLADGHPCLPVAGSGRPVASAPGWTARTWRVECGSGVRSIESRMSQAAPGRLHFVRVRRGQKVSETVLTGSTSTWILEEGRAERVGGTSFWGFVQLGVKHILSGYDHLVFLLVLVIASLSVSQVAFLVTGFTIGHSVTLGLAVAGNVSPDVKTVEALIGVSIAVVAVENVWSIGSRGPWIPRIAGGALALLAGAVFLRERVVPWAFAGVGLFTLCYFALLSRSEHSERLRWGVAGLFGLVHGFGFAASLGELDMPAGRTAEALFGFNTGVELGQLVVVLAIWPLLLLVRRRAGQEALLGWGSAAALSVGIFWALTRTFS